MPKRSTGRTSPTKPGNRPGPPPPPRRHVPPTLATPKPPAAPAGTSGEEAAAGSWAALIEAAQAEIVVVTHRFDPDRLGSPGVVTVRFSGQRLDVEAKPGAGDRFSHEEVVEGVGGGDGPMAVTARVGGVNPGRWEVRAQAMAGRQTQQAPPVGRWLPWREPAAGAEQPVTTCLKPFAKVPGLVRFGWLTMAVVGMALGLVVQGLVAAHDHASAGAIWPIALLGLVAGVAGAKVWFVVKHRGEHRIEGWCVQGFVTGFVVATLAALAGVGVSIPLFFDAAAPGLFFGLAVGRLGCLVGGCCYGRPTTSRLGLWSSDQRVIRRRIPTQLVELALLAVIGAGALAADLAAGTQGGGIFVAAVAVYVVGRQPILALRGEPSRWSRAAAPIAGAAAAALIADAACVAVACLA